MKLKVITDLVVTLFLASMLTLAFNIGIIKGTSKTETIHVASDETDEWLNAAANKNYSIQINQVYSCDKFGNPRESFFKGFPVYFNVTINNAASKALNTSIAISVYDGGNVPLGVVSFQTTIAPNATVSFLKDFLIPKWAYSGTGKLYANAYTPEGLPYGPEKSDSFKIKFPGDVNGDGSIDGYDATMLSLSWWVGCGQPDYQQEVDFNVDGFVGGYDAVTISMYWWTHAPEP